MHVIKLPRKLPLALAGVQRVDCKSCVALSPEYDRDVFKEIL